MQANILLGNKYITAKKLWKETNQELQELKYYRICLVYFFHDTFNS